MASAVRGTRWDGWEQPFAADDDAYPDDEEYVDDEDDDPTTLEDWLSGWSEPLTAARERWLLADLDAEVRDLQDRIYYRDMAAAAGGTVDEAAAAVDKERLARLTQFRRQHPDPPPDTDETAEAPPSDLTAEHIERFYHDRIAAGAKPRSVAYMHAVLHKALRDAVRRHLIPWNAADAVVPPRNSAERIARSLTIEEAQRLLEAASEDRGLGPLYVLAVYTGMRQGELLGLRWGDVDLTAAYLTVERTLAWIPRPSPKPGEPKGQWEYGAPKSRAGMRTVALAPAAVQALREHQIREATRLLVLGRELGRGTLVFSDQWGEPLRGRHITTRSLPALLARAGLPPIRFHDLRHTAATLLLRAGVSPHEVAAHLGHSQVQMTLQVYAHVLDGMQRQNMAKLGQLLDKGYEKGYVTPPEQTEGPTLRTNRAADGEIGTAYRNRGDPPVESD
jgi:integrase